VNAIDPAIFSKVNDFLVDAGKGFAFLFLCGIAYFVIILQDSKSPNKEVDKDDDSGAR